MSFEDPTMFNHRFAYSGFWQKHGIASDLAMLNKWKYWMSQFFLSDAWLLCSFFILSPS